MKKNRKKLIFILLIFFASAVQSQNENALHFIGYNFFDNKELTGTTIKVVSNNKTVKELNTDKENKFKVVLPFGQTYDMYLINARCQTMFLRIFADIPQEKRDRKITYEIKIPFFEKDPETFDTTEFRNPFHKIIFNGRNVFVDDTVYMNTFLTKVVKKEKTEPVVKSVVTKELVQLAGKLCFDNDKQTPLKNKSISLINKKGEIISTSQTTNFGLVVFQKVDLEQADGLSVKLNEIDNPNKEKIKLSNSLSELILVSQINSNQIYEFKNTTQNHLIEKMIDKNFRYNIGGKLVGTDNGVKKIMIDKTVYLMDSRNNVIQKTKTNALGSFLFQKILANQNYGVAFDQSEFDSNTKLSLYTTKDKFIRNIDSVKNKRYNYQFLTIASTTFNDIVIDDIELKMNVKGRLCGNNKNNPLNNLKIYILDDKYQVLDSTMTGNDGSFSMEDISNIKNISISAKNIGNILESFNNILVFDNAENLLKVVSLTDEKKFNYRPLPLELNKLADVYIDDPWLKIINRKDKKQSSPSQTIIEPILFEFNKADLLPQSQQTLDKVILVMNANTHFKVELSAHTDSKGSDSYNLKLSEQRAVSAKNYIASKGIDVNRIIAIGFGETKLLNNCGNSILCSEDEHAVNRRLEFKLIFEE